MSDLQLCIAKPLRKHKVGFIANKKSVFEDRKLILSFVVKKGRSRTCLRSVLPAFGRPSYLPIACLDFAAASSIAFWASFLPSSALFSSPQIGSEIVGQLSTFGANCT